MSKFNIRSICESLLAALLFSLVTSTALANDILYQCVNATENSAYFSIYKELAAVNNDPNKSYEAESSSDTLARQVLLPRAFPEKLSLSYNPKDRKLRFTYLQLATESQDGNVDLLEKLLFRQASENPLDESLWIDDFQDEILRLPEVSLFREKLMRKQKGGKAPLSLGDFSRMSDAIVAYLKGQNFDPRTQLQLRESADKWNWGDPRIDNRETTGDLRQEHGPFVLLRNGNYGLIKISENNDYTSLLGNAPARCERIETP